MTPHRGPFIEVPYQAHSESSREAAVSMKPRVKTLEEKVYATIKSAGADGLTDEEVFQRIYLEEVFVRVVVKESTVRARRVRLVELNRVAPAVEDCGTCYRTRKTQSGRNAQVWVADNFNQLEQP